MADVHNDDENRNAEEDSARPERPQGPHEPSAADHFWVAVLVVIIVVLILVGILSNIDMNDSGSSTQDWNTVWH
ncbi:MULTISPECIES: hypothetical protein [Streptomyces]|uniref:Putative integral membrane protein n=1 Tax=Streptomyces nymphaeiformis TaxID=2663842 RepID=A0A7W7U7Z4_9ACTN|nr:hypothetical protein [Streptomyces nymphaeiformis]MBB4986680.1 putative integral membrane protein [Streptomyces nymphaeiformis]